MSIFSYDKIRKLKPGEFRVYNYITTHMESVPGMNIRQLAESTEVSTTTVLRFCEKMGCAGYTELKYRIRCELSEQKAKGKFDVVPALEFIKNAEQEELFQGKKEEVAELIAQAGQVIVSGDGESGALARYGAQLFNAAGKAAFSCEAGKEAACPDEASRSVLLILSVSGEREGVISLADRYKTSGASVVSITNTEQCPAARMSDVNFSCYMPETYGTGKRETRISQIPVIYILESLAAAVQSLI